MTMSINTHEALLESIANKYNLSDISLSPPEIVQIDEIPSPIPTEKVVKNVTKPIVLSKAEKRAFKSGSIINTTAQIDLKMPEKPNKKKKDKEEDEFDKAISDMMKYVYPNMEDHSRFKQYSDYNYYMLGGNVEKSKNKSIKEYRSEKKKNEEDSKLNDTNNLNKYKSVHEVISQQKRDEAKSREIFQKKKNNFGVSKKGVLKISSDSIKKINRKPVVDKKKKKKGGVKSRKEKSSLF